MPLSELKTYEAIRKLRMNYRYQTYRGETYTFLDIIEGRYVEHNAYDQMSRMQGACAKLFIEGYRPINYINEKLYWPIEDTKSRLEFLDKLYYRAKKNYFSKR